MAQMSIMMAWQALNRIRCGIFLLRTTARKTTKNTTCTRGAKHGTHERNT